MNLKIKISAIIGVLGIILGLYGCSSNNYDEYVSSLDSAMSIYQGAQLYPEFKLTEMVYSDYNPKYQFIDVRTPHEYSTNHLDSAINMPLKSILSADLSIFEDNEKVFLIYGQDASQAKLAYAFLTQLGVQNIQAVGGGFEYIYEVIFNQKTIEGLAYNDELARHDFAKVISETPKGQFEQNVNENRMEVPIVNVPKKEEEVGGGCG
ncbi:MAG: rhodanese-like domain-containing protein [Bacteroidales bacterium]|nr:rhodanese-like domain-containing protein [Bacteroidales bacterium]